MAMTVENLVNSVKDVDVNGGYTTSTFSIDSSMWAYVYGQNTLREMERSTPQEIQGPGLKYLSYIPLFDTPHGMFEEAAKLPDGQQILVLLKKSLKDIEAEPFDGKVRQNILAKAGRLQKAGATAQAAILEAEVALRDSLTRLKDWDYKVLTKKAIEEYKEKYFNWDGIQGHVDVHIDSLEVYQGNPEVGVAKDRIIPDAVLDKIEEANERKVFDKVQVLWVEKVVDPLLLGCVNGCEDYFFICEWGNDVIFDEIMKGEGSEKDAAIKNPMF